MAVDLGGRQVGTLVQASRVRGLVIVPLPYARTNEIRCVRVGGLDPASQLLAPPRGRPMQLEGTRRIVALGRTSGQCPYTGPPVSRLSRAGKARWQTGDRWR